MKIAAIEGAYNIDKDKASEITKEITLSVLDNNISTKRNAESLAKQVCTIYKEIFKTVYDLGSSPKEPRE